MKTYLKIVKSNYRGIDSFTIEHYDVDNPEEIIDYIVVKKTPIGLSEGIKYYLEENVYKYDEKKLKTFAKYYDFINRLLKDLDFVDVTEGDFHRTGVGKICISFRISSKQKGSGNKNQEYVSLADLNKVIDFIEKKFGKIDYEKSWVIKNRITLVFPFKQWMLTTW